MIALSRNQLQRRLGSGQKQGGKDPLNKAIKPHGALRSLSLRALIKPAYEYIGGMINTGIASRTMAP